MRIHGDTLALVTIARLDHHGCANLRSRTPRVLFIINRSTHRDGNARSSEKTFGEFLILCDFFGNRAGGIDLGSLNPPLPATPAKLHQAAAGQAPMRNTPRHRSLDDCAGGWPEPNIRIQFTQSAHCIGEIKWGVIDSRAQQCDGHFECQPSNILLGVLHDHLKDSGLRSSYGSAETDLTAGDRLQTESGQFQCMCHGKSPIHLGLGQGTDIRKPLTQPVNETRHLRQIGFVLTAYDQSFNGRVTNPEVGAAQCAKAGNFHGQGSLS